MTYEQAQLIIDDASQHDDLALGLRSLNNLAKKLKKMRVENGCVLLCFCKLMKFNDNFCLSEL